MQYHWKNRDYKNFDEFLMDMKQSKRKNIRQERKKVCLVSSFHIILIVQFILVS
jgi:predicted N-acyltransferase